MKVIAFGMLNHVVLWVIKEVSEESLLHLQRRILDLRVYLEYV
jgi:hypothetical protein